MGDGCEAYSNNLFIPAKSELTSSTFSEKGDQRMSGSRFFNVTICSSLCFIQKRGLEITVFLFFDFSF